MKRKIVGIFAVTLLIATALTVNGHIGDPVGFGDNNQGEDNAFFILRQPGYKVAQSFAMKTYPILTDITLKLRRSSPLTGYNVKIEIMDNQYNSLCNPSYIPDDEIPLDKFEEITITFDKPIYRDTGKHTKVIIQYENPNDFYWIDIAYDNRNLYGGTSLGMSTFDHDWTYHSQWDLFFITYGRNNQKPTTFIHGRDLRFISLGDPIAFHYSVEDADGDRVYIEWDFNNDGVPDKTYNVDTNPGPKSELLTFDSLGTYNVRVRANDPFENGDWSSPSKEVRCTEIGSYLEIVLTIIDVVLEIFNIPWPF